MWRTIQRLPVEESLSRIHEVISIKSLIALLTDILIAPFTVFSSVLLKAIRRMGVARMPVSRKIFYAVGVFPILDHYYEPMFNRSNLGESLRENRYLPGLDLNIQGQLDMLEQFNFNDELEQLPIIKPEDGPGRTRFYYQNDSFKSGDAEYFYNMIRLHKPSMLVEIGSGYSTLVAREAIKRNIESNSHYSCDHICIEPYGKKWLDDLDVTVIRELVENVNKDLFLALRRNDILFIDSSHVIRPQGDVLFEYLEVLPLLRPGVFVHSHDIFTPKDYPPAWVSHSVRFWNEQYLLEAFMSFNDQYKIVGALNFLSHNYQAELAAKCPIYMREASQRRPGSFWIVRE